MTQAVVLLHGLGRSPRSMWWLARALRRDSHVVVNQDYPSTRAPVEVLADFVGQGVARCPPGATVHLVTHSMGGILARIWLARHRPARLGRVVMLAPPNAGSEIVDRLGGWRLYRAINGPAGQQLGTGLGSVPRSLPPVDYPLGIIAGTRGIEPFSLLLPRPNDGKVAAAATGVAGMTDQILLPVTHTFLMNSPAVIAQVRAFLRDGRFQR